VRQRALRPPTRRNPLGELASLRKTGTVDDYTEHFLAHVARAGPLNEQQQVNIYTVGLLEPLKMDVELQNPQDMEMAMSLARAYEGGLAVISDANKTPTTKSVPRALPLKVPSSTAPTTAPASGSSLAAPPRPFKHLTAKEMAERHRSGLYFNCDEHFTRSHKCKHLFDITAVNDYDSDDVDNSLLMMIGTEQSPVRGYPPMYLTGVVSRTGVHILEDTGATHNVININVAHLISLLEQRIDTTILVGSGNEVPCSAAAFSVPLCIDADIYIDAYLLDIGNDVNIILGTPWFAGLGRLTWDFSAMELQHFRNSHPITFTTVHPRHAPATIRALPAPPLIKRATQEAMSLSPPRNILNRANRARRPNALDYIDTTNIIFEHLR
jgi:hypothetical protein